jgi:hypothetical protein
MCFTKTQVKLEVKQSLCMPLRHTGAPQVQLHMSVNSALGGASQLGCYSSKEIPQSPGTGGWVGTRDGQDIFKKWKILLQQGNKPQTVQPIAQAILAQ